MTPTMKMMWHVTVGCSMLVPLPLGMQDHRVSSAESEARRKIPSRLNLRHTREFVGEVARRQTMEASIDQHRQFVVDPLGRSKPVQITEERCHGLGSTGCVDHSRIRVEHGPQSVRQPIRDASECRIAVVEARQHQWHNERHNRRTNAAESRSTAKLLDTTFETWVLVLTSQSRYIPTFRAEADGTMTSTPTRRPGCDIWCWRRMDAYLSTSVLAVLSWRRLDCIHFATSSTHPETRSCSCRTSDGGE